MTRQGTFKRYFLVALLFVVLVMSLVLTACGSKHVITWKIDEHATVTVKDAKKLPESVKDGEIIEFTIATDFGYVVDEVLRGKVSIIPNDKGVYSFTVADDITISVTTKKKIGSINVTSKPTKLTYTAGESLDKTGMVVELEYALGGSEVITDYELRYQSNNASNFKLGDTYFTVYYESIASDPVMLDETVAALIVLDPVGGTISEEYVNALQTNAAIKDVTTEGGLVSFKYTAPLEENVALPTKAHISKGEVAGDYSFNAWQVNGEGDWMSVLAKENVTSITLKANWTNYLADISAVNFEVTNGIPNLVIEGTYRAATSVYTYITEGNRIISYSFDNAQKGQRGEAFTLRANMLELVNAEAQDKGSFVGPWLDLRIAYNVDGRIESMEIPYVEALHDGVSVTDGDEEYRFAFQTWGGMLKLVIAPTTPYSYTMTVDNTNDVITLTFDGKIKEAFIENYAGATVKIDWWTNKTVAEEAVIAKDGSWRIVFELSPENGFVLDTLGYAHFSIINTDSGVVLYKDGNDGNLLANALTNRDELTHHDVPHGDFTGDSLEISNSDGTLVYYVGMPWWDAIVIYGYNPLAPQFSVSGEIELKVDNFNAPTKVYYVVKLTVEKNLTADEVFAIVLGNTDGDINVYNSDRARSKIKGNVYTLWFDVTSYAGGQLWPNLYMPKTVGEGDNATITYEKCSVEVGGDSDYSTDGLYAIVNGVKYSIICSEGTWARPCLVVGTPKDGETNPPEVDPDAVPKEITVDANYFDLVKEDDKAYVIVKISVDGFKDADEIKALIKYGDIAHDFEWTTDCVKVEEVVGGYKLWFDITEMKMGTDGKLWSGLYIGTKQTVVRVIPNVANGKSITIGETVYAVVCNAETWSIPCLVTKAVDEPEYAATGVDIVLEGSTVYFVVSGTYANVNVSDVETLLADLHFDLQKNSFINNNYTWDNQDWTSYENLDRLVTVSNGNWSIKFDVTNLDRAAYGAHMNDPIGLANGDLKLDYTATHGNYVVVGGNRYALYNFYGSGDANFYYGCVGLRIFVDETFYEALDVTLEKDDTDAYYVIKGVSKGYTEETLKTALLAAYFGLQHNANAGASDWDEFTSFDKKVTFNADGSWELKIKITSLNASAYTTHFVSDVMHNNNNDLKLPNKANNGTVIEVANKRYTLVNRFGSGEGSDFWGCIGVIIENIA